MSGARKGKEKFHSEGSSGPVTELALHVRWGGFFFFFNSWKREGVIKPKLISFSVSL